MPRHIGVITSPTGAVVRDIISTLRRRFPAIAVTVIPVTVQGDSAANEIIQAIEVANRKKGCLSNLDLLIIGRGGGSLEDLWSFNNEALARCIFASDLPIVSAVGHEVDFTIADFVADLRAATPTAAAEIISPDQEEYRVLFSAYTRQFAAIIQEMIRQKQQGVLWLKKRLKHPGRKLQEHAQALDEKEARLQRAFNNRLHMIKGQLKQLHLGIRAHTPQRMIREYQQEYNNKGHRLLKAVRQDLQNKKLQLAEHSHALNTVSPLSTLGRGYSITYSDTHQVITDYQSVNAGDTIRSRLLNGEIISKVDTSTKLKDPSSKKGKNEKSS